MGKRQFDSLPPRDAAAAFAPSSTSNVLPISAQVSHSSRVWLSKIMDFSLAPLTCTHQYGCLPKVSAMILVSVEMKRLYRKSGMFFSGVSMGRCP
ncbi:hypothetical protein D3C76_1234230 [compost metagenome]